MLRILVTNNVHVFRYLGSSAFQRLEVEQAVASDADSVRRLVREFRPQIAILDRDVAGGSGIELSRWIKSDPELSSIQVLLLQESIVSLNDLEAIRTSRCDDILFLPLHPDDFYFHIVQLAGLNLRRELRIPVSLEVHVLQQHQRTLGKFINLSPTGAGIEIPQQIDKGPATLVIRNGNQPPMEIKSRVAWCHPKHDGSGFFAGLTFVHVPTSSRVALEQLYLFEVLPNRVDGAISVAIQGEFDERTDFSGILRAVKGEAKIDFNLRSVKYIGSSGVRRWCEFLGQLHDCEYTFRHCSLAFTSQAAMVPLLLGEGHMLSSQAPYHCNNCDRDELRLVELGLIGRDGEKLIPPPLNCSSCGSALEFDDIPERYFAFLLETENPKGGNQ